MQQPPNRLDDANPDDVFDATVEARALHQRLVFWRRAAWLLLGIIVLVGVVMWQRAEDARRSCRTALEHYTHLAHATRLAQEPEPLLEMQWQRLDEDGVRYQAAHFELLVPDWKQAPHAGESTPLAVCRAPHTLLTGKGRHVLYRENDQYRIEWKSEAELADILEQLHRKQVRR